MALNEYAINGIAWNIKQAVMATDRHQFPYPVVNMSIGDGRKLRHLLYVARTSKLPVGVTLETIYKAEAILTVAIERALRAGQRGQVSFRMKRDDLDRLADVINIAERIEAGGL